MAEIKYMRDLIICMLAFTAGYIDNARNYRINWKIGRSKHHIENILTTKFKCIISECITLGPLRRPWLEKLKM